MPSKKVAVTLRMDDKLHEQLKRLAFEAHESLNLYCIGILEREALSKTMGGKHA